MEAAAFWRALDRDPSPGELALGVLTSWKSVADHLGFAGVDFASGVFDLLGRQTWDEADLRSRLSTTVIGGYWREQGKAAAARDELARWTPIMIETPTMSIRLEVASTVIGRRSGESGESVYARVRHELDQLVAALPVARRYPPLPHQWRDLIEA